MPDTSCSDNVELESESSVDEKKALDQKLLTVLSKLLENKKHRFGPDESKPQVDTLADSK